MVPIHFLNNLNKFSGLKFTWKISKVKVTFLLYVDIFLKHGPLKTNLHIKGNNSIQYPDFTSCHPNHVKKISTK